MIFEKRQKYECLYPNEKQAQKDEIGIRPIVRNSNLIKIIERIEFAMNTAWINEYLPDY